MTSFSEEKILKGVKVEKILPDLWLDCFSFMVNQLFGNTFLQEWEGLTDAVSLQQPADDEQAFDFELSEWEKKLFLITEVVNTKITENQKALDGKIMRDLSEEEKAKLKEVFNYKKLGGAFRQLFFAILWKIHPEAQGPWNVGIREDFKVVRAPIKTMPMPSELIPVEPGQLQEVMKAIKEGKLRPGGMN